MSSGSRVRRAIRGVDVALVGLVAQAMASSPGAHGAVPAPTCDAQLASPSTYRVFRLPLVPAAINRSGRVAGTTREHRAAVWSNDAGLTLLPMSGPYVYSDAVAINAAGQVVVVAYDKDLSHRGTYVFSQGAMRVLPGEQARGFRINDAGLIAGEALAPGTVTSGPVVWAHEGIRNMTACCAGTAKDINFAGSVVGDVYDEHGRFAAVLWSPDGRIERIGPEAGYSSAIAINDMGHALVDLFTEIQLYASGRRTTLKLAARLPSHPRGMNNCDVVVGEYGPFSDKDRAFRWTPAGGFEDLNALLPANSHWKLKSASAVNDLGTIVGRGDIRQDEDEGFLLVPDPTG